MVLLWGFLASALRSGRGSGSILTEVVTALVAEAGRDGGRLRPRPTDTDDRPKSTHLTRWRTRAATRNARDRKVAAKPNPQPEGGDTDSDEVEPTKKGLYAEAQETGIEGRSTMSKGPLKEALDE